MLTESKINPVHQRIMTCHQCPRAGRAVAGVRPCTVDGANILAHAEHDDCPIGFYTPGATISLARSGIHRPIAGPTASSPRLIAARLMTCQGCEHVTKKDDRAVGCSLCGCQLGSKLRDTESTCPAKKWGPVAPENREAWYSHTGALGDIIYALSGIRATIGGKKAALYIHHDAAVRPSDYMTPAHVEAVEPLLLAQHYIAHVEHTNPWPTATHRLDTFRDLDIHRRDLVTLHRLALGIDAPWEFEPWLTVPKKTHVAKVLFARSPRYANPRRREIWGALRAKYPDAVFVGLPSEYQAFCREAAEACNCHNLPNIPFHPTANLLELAEVIAGAELFCGNQSSPFAIATGLGVDTVLEVDPTIPNCCFDRPGAVDLWTSTNVPNIDAAPSPAVLVFHDLDLTGHPDRKRVENARFTWRWAKGTDKGLSLLPFQPERSSRDIGDTRSVPYLRDLFDAGADAARDGIVIWCNLDCCIVPEAMAVLRRELQFRPCVYSRRVDVKDAKKNLQLPDLMSRTVHPGTDLFAFHADWWRKVRDGMPDMFIACEAFDFILRRIMERDNPRAQVGPLLYHEEHEPFWRDPANLTINPAQAHNRRLAVEWCKANGFADRLAGEGAAGLLLDDAAPALAA